MPLSVIMTYTLIQQLKYLFFFSLQHFLSSMPSCLFFQLFFFAGANAR